MTTGTAVVPERVIDWRAFRIVPSRFPPVGPWDRIAAPTDFEALSELEGLTNPRIRAELGVLGTIPRHRWVSGPATTPIMAVFSHLNPEGSRFSDGSYGVFYAAQELETAIRETVFHRERFLARTREPAQQIQMRCYVSRIKNAFHDIRGGHPPLHDPDDYTASQAFGRRLRRAESNGIVYDSVRHHSGHCVAAFWPDCVGPCAQGKHFAYGWDGKAIRDVIELSAVEF